MDTAFTALRAWPVPTGKHDRDSARHAEDFKKILVGRSSWFGRQPKMSALKIRVCIRKDSGNVERLDELQQITSLQTQQPGSGGTIALGLCQGVDDHFAAVFIDALVIGRRH
jgi:hypothetical protein